MAISAPAPHADSSAQGADAVGLSGDGDAKKGQAFNYLNRSERRNKSSTFIYVIGANCGAQKVGQSASPLERLSLLNWQMGGGLLIHATVRVPYQLGRGVEQHAHHLLKPWSLGKELFEVPPQWAAVAVQQASEEVPQIYLKTFQVRNARVMLGWTYAAFSAKTGISCQTLTMAMQERREWPAVNRVSMLAIRTALEAAGIEFIAEDDAGATGIRMKKRTSPPV